MISNDDVPNGANTHPFLLHIAACENDMSEVVRLLAIPFYRENIDMRDLHGYPASHYAIHFGHKDILVVLLENGADPTKKSLAGWSCMQESLGRCDKELVSILLHATKIKIHNEFKKRIPNLLNALNNIPDFEMDLKWEFKSWVPLVSRFCPYDNYKIFKKGSSFRVNTTITGIEGITFKRGDLSFIFNGDHHKLYSVDFIKKQYAELSLAKSTDAKAVEEEEVDILMGVKNINRVKLLQELIVFSPAKSWFGNEKHEKIGDSHGWNAKIYNVSGIELKIMSRKNRLANSHKDKKEIADHETTTTTTTKGDSVDETDIQSHFIRKKDLKIRESIVRNKILAKDYFSVPHNFDIKQYIEKAEKPKIKEQGLLCEGESVSTKSKNFEGTIWISQDFPRRITDLLPIFEVLTPTNKLFSRLNEFVSLKFPSDGFPVKLDFPVVPTITATVTFQGYVEKNDIPASLFEVPGDFIKKKKLDH